MAPLVSCFSCGNSFRSLRSHLARNIACSLAYYSADSNSNVSRHPPIPTEIDTNSSVLPIISEVTTEIPDSVSARLRRRRTSFNYAESARRPASNRSREDDGVPTPDDDLGDYITTFFDNDHPGSSSTAIFNPETTSPVMQSLFAEQHQQDMLELAVDSWQSLYGTSVEAEDASSVAAR
jgi:hypothetical protein